MIPLQEQENLRRYLAEQLTGPVKIEHFTQRPLTIVVPGREECRFCQEVRQLLDDVRSLSSKISVRVHELSEARDLVKRYNIERPPATVLRGQLNRPLWFYGFFSGSLFPGMISTIIRVSTGTTGLSPRAKRRLQRIRDDIAVRLFVTPASPYSPGMMQMLYQFSLDNPHIKAAVIEAEEFPRLIEARKIHAVPYTMIGDRTSFAGAVDEATFLDQIVKVAEGQSLTVGEGLLGTTSRPTTPLGTTPEPITTRGGLIIPGR